MNRARIIAALLGLVFSSASAWAQNSTNFELQQMRPNPDVEQGGLVSIGARVAEPGKGHALLLINYANNPLVLYNAQNERVATAVSRQAIIHLMGTVGLFGFMDVGVDLPTFVHQAGETLPISAPDIRHGASLGDLRVIPKAQFLNRRWERLGVDLTGAAALDLYLPTGDGSGLRGSDFRFGPLLAFDAAFTQGWHLGTNLGYLRRLPRLFTNLVVGDLALWSIYGETPAWGKVRFTAEFVGRFGDAGQRLHAPVELMMGARTITNGWTFVGGVGAGIGRSYGTPDWRALLAVEFPIGKRAPPSLPAPVVEASPPAPPAPVPVAPEPVVVKPTPALVLINKDTRRLELADAVHFKTASSELAQESLPLLDEVAKVLSDHPEIKVLTIEGHTDIRGGHAYNIRLSKARSKSLRTYLVSKGVEASRLKTAGYGPDKPIADNATDEGRAKNRRVEFRIDEITWEVL